MMSAGAVSRWVRGSAASHAELSGESRERLMPRGYILPNAAVGETGIIYRKNNNFGP